MTDKHEIVPKAETLPVRGVLHPAVEKVLATNPTPETLREILTLQREWEAGEAKRQFTRALVELRRDLPAFIAKDQTVDYANKDGRRTHYTHASLAATMQAVLPALTAHGFSLAWTPAMSDKGVSVTATLTHKEGHAEHATLSAPPDQSGSKSTPQAIASTCTLLQRYTALALLGLATADMEEPRGVDPRVDGGVDSARNMRAMAAIVKAGKTKAEAEKLVGKPVTAWTVAELDTLRAWLEPPAETEPQAEPPPEEAEEPTRVTAEEWEAFKGVLAGCGLKWTTARELIFHETGVSVARGSDLTPDICHRIASKLAKVKEGAIGLNVKEARFIEPPASVAKE